MKLKRGKKMTYTYNRNYNAKSFSEIVRGLQRSKYWLDKDFAFVRVFGTIRATRKTGDKGVTVFHNLDADAISEVYISDSALRQPKDSGNAKMLVACLRVVSLRCQFFSDIFTKQPHPLPA